MTQIFFHQWDPCSEYWLQFSDAKLLDTSWKLIIRGLCPRPLGLWLLCTLTHMHTQSHTHTHTNTLTHTHTHVFIAASGICQVLGKGYLKKLKKKKEPHDNYELSVSIFNSQLKEEKMLFPESLSMLYKPELMFSLGSGETKAEERAHYSSARGVSDEAKLLWWRNAITRATCSRGAWNIHT